MKVLAIYAHPNPESFNHAVLESFTKGLKDGRHLETAYRLGKEF